MTALRAMLTGYLHPDYAASFSDSGSPVALANCGGWLVTRSIPGSTLRDAMGCYPLFCCQQWNALGADLASLRELVSVVVVTDPLGAYRVETLESAFDRTVPFRVHYIAEGGRPLGDFVSQSHSRHARRALKSVEVEECRNPPAFLDDWERLYGVLTARHSIGGLRRFSRAAFQRQLSVPGMVMFRALAGGRTVGMELWYLQGDCAQSHLAAFDDEGYRLRASYATRWRALEALSARVRWMNLGGTTAGSVAGLAAFKRGWASAERTAWLCGRVLQPQAYEALAKAAGRADGAYFPAYRHGEFT